MTKGTVADLVDDLAAEHDALDRLVEAIADDDWSAATPSPGWTVADQVGHLGYFDRTATLAIADPDGFAVHLVEAVTAMQAGGGLDDISLAEPRGLATSELLGWWRGGATSLVAAARTLDDGDRLAWYGPSMGARSFLTARLMETWAHGHDIADTFDAPVEPTVRLRHIAQLGVITRRWSHEVRGQTASEVEVRVELAAPDGTEWTWGDADAVERIAGPALDFCRVVTQRRHVDDTALAVTGDAAMEWMRIAQAFAGAPTDGPDPRSTR